MNGNLAGLSDLSNSRIVSTLMPNDANVHSVERSTGWAPSADVISSGVSSANIVRHSTSVGSAVSGKKRTCSAVSNSRPSLSHIIADRSLSDSTRVEQSKRPGERSLRLATQLQGTGEASETPASDVDPAGIFHLDSHMPRRSETLATCLDIALSMSKDRRLQHEPVPAIDDKEVAVGDTEHPRLLRSLEACYSVTEEQLDTEVRRIYAGLAMVEGKAIELYQQHGESGEPLSPLQCQVLVSLHESLLKEHHDFYLASMNPSSSSVAKQLAEKYSMPARMWRYGIHSLLEMLRHRLPDSLEYMTKFIHLAYPILILMVETVTRFEQTWIECLGDLARYRMALEETDVHERELWAGVARYWYNKVADRSPGLGRIQHHLAVVSQSDIALQLFHYTKSFVSVHPFPAGRDSILILFKSLLEPSRSNSDPVMTAFVCIHGQFFIRQISDELVMLVDYFLSALEKRITHLGAAFRLQGVYIMSCNIAAIFEYGHPDAALSAELGDQADSSESQVYRSASPECWTPADRLEEIEINLLSSRSPSRLMFTSGTYFAFQTFNIILGQIGDKNTYPAVHLTLAFIWSMSSNYDIMDHLETAIPWMSLAVYLNTMIRSDIDIDMVDSDQFPASEMWRILPEDYCIRGQVWAKQYYSQEFFEPATAEEDGRWVETLSLNIIRAYRCLWLGGRIVAHKRWLEYDAGSRKFSPTSFATELEKRAHLLYPFSPSSSDFSEG